MARLVALSDLVDFDKTKADGFRFIFGIDEVGRGPLAGPVVAAAVCIRDPHFSCKLGDSKLLSARQREQAFHEILRCAWIGLGIMSEQVIDSVNILNASHLAMTAAVRDLMGRLSDNIVSAPDFNSSVKLLIDGNSYAGSLGFKYETVVKGDSQSLAIACASIVAKVYRDRMMEMYDRLYPGYGLAKHKGYPTAEHRSAIRSLGLSPLHRKTFASG